MWRFHRHITSILCFHSCIIHIFNGETHQSDQSQSVGHALMRILCARYNLCLFHVVRSFTRSNFTKCKLHETCVTNCMMAFCILCCAFHMKCLFYATEFHGRKDDLQGCPQSWHCWHCWAQNIFIQNNKNEKLVFITLGVHELFDLSPWSSDPPVQDPSWLCLVINRALLWLPVYKLLSIVYLFCRWQSKA